MKTKQSPIIEWYKEDSNITVEELLLKQHEHTLEIVLKVIGENEKKLLNKHRIMGEDSPSGGWVVLYSEDVDEAFNHLRQRIKEIK